MKKDIRKEIGGILARNGLSTRQTAINELMILVIGEIGKASHELRSCLRCEDCKLCEKHNSL